MTADRTASPPAQPLVIRADDARSCSLSPGSRMTFPFAGDGHPELVVERAVRGDAPPQHRHPWASWEVVIEGAVRVVIGGEEHLLGPGDAIYTPPHVAHGYVVESERALIVGLNGEGTRFMNLQTQAEGLFRAPGGPNMPEVLKLASSHGVEVLGPPLTPRSGEATAKA